MWDLKKGSFRGYINLWWYLCFWLIDVDDPADRGNVGFEDLVILFTVLCEPLTKLTAGAADVFVGRTPFYILCFCA